MTTTYGRRGRVFIAPLEVEAVLLTDAAVRQADAVGVPDRARDEDRGLMNAGEGYADTGAAARSAPLDCSLRINLSMSHCRVPIAPQGDDVRVAPLGRVGDGDGVLVHVETNEEGARLFHG